jgi:hypothetical protein
LQLLRVKFSHTSLVLVAITLAAPAYRLALTAGLQHSPLLLQLAVVEVTRTPLQVVVEILLIAQEALVLLALREVLQVHSRSHTQAVALLLESLKAALAQSLAALLTEQVDLAALQIRAGLAGLVPLALYILRGIEVKN